MALYPTIYAISTSLTKYSVIDPTAGKEFIGLENYINIFLSSRFWSVLGRSAVFVSVSVLGSYVLGSFLAILLHKAGQGKAFFRIIFLVPMVIAPAITALNFKFMFNYDFGVINYFLTILGLPRQTFLGSPNLALFSIVSVDIWQWTPFVVLVMLAGLEALPSEPFEAAQIDGATGLQIHRYITFPLLRRFTLIVLIIRTMDAFRSYAKFDLMTGGGPGVSSETLSFYIAKVGFNWFHTGEASALAFISINISALLAMLFLKYTRAFSEVS